MPEIADAPRRGDTLTDIRLTGPSGDGATLNEETAGSRSVVFFLRASTCAVCLGHARNLAAMKASGELGDARVLAITPGGPSEAETVQSRLHSDTVSVWASGDGHAAVGLGKFLMLQHSGTFVLDADGSILSARTATLPTGAFSKDEVKAALAA